MHAARSLLLFKLHGNVDGIHTSEQINGTRVLETRGSHDPDFIYNASAGTIGIAMCQRRGAARR